MKKAKTRKNILSILSAVLGAVFALITGITYCITNTNFVFGKNANSTSAFMSNQQYHIINDTTNNPIIFGEGARNIEIALQYSMPYDFDVRFDYTLTWSGGSPNSNVILHFANRDNIIYDENYIYFAENLTAGNNKVTFITGVDFIETVDDATYYGQTLSIEITNVKIYKKQTSYALASHSLTKTIQSSVAAQAWTNYKNRNSSSTNYVMMYNARRNHDNGVVYPGPRTAYKKGTDTSTNTVTRAIWTGGNKSYAGVGMYVIAGNQPLNIRLELTGIWRYKPGTVAPEGGSPVVDASPAFISENCIKLNYTSEWFRVSWDDFKLWETREFIYTIPAGTACYIDILDNIEVTSGSWITSNEYDAYRAVINTITLNANLGTDYQTKFTYTETSSKFIEMKTVKNNTATSVVPSKTSFSKTDVKVVNSSSYSQGLYEAQIGKSTAQQEFNTNISLINNEPTIQKVTLTYNLKCYISNGWSNFTNSSGLRAEELDGITATTFAQHFDKFYNNDSLHYGFSFDPDDMGLSSNYFVTADSSFVSQVTLSPYSTVNVMAKYAVSASLQGDIKTKFVDPNAVSDGTEDYFDVWTYVEVEISTEEVADNSTTEYSTENSDLIIETQLSGSTVYLLVKNNSLRTVKGIEISKLSIQEWHEPDPSDSSDWQLVTSPTDVKLQPSDWNASYWKYYNSNKELFETNPINDVTAWKDITVYSGSQGFVGLTESSTAQNSFTKSGDSFTHSTKILQPGERVVFAKATVTDSKSIFVSGNAYANQVAKPSELSLVNSGSKDAHIINNTTSAYYVSFSGTVLATKDYIFTDSNMNYYIGIVRPNQVVSVPMTAMGTLAKVEVTGDFDATKLTSWSTNAKTKMQKYFALIKT